jgi:hypothetical protein
MLVEEAGLANSNLDLALFDEKIPTAYVSYLAQINISLLVLKTVVRAVTFVLSNGD